MHQEKVKKTVYVGLDDSNHAGTRKGEIILATFSLNREDSIVCPYKNGRDLQAAQLWMNHPQHDYRYTLLVDELWRHRSDNIPRVAPVLIENYLQQHNEIGAIKIYVDGRLDHTGKHLLRVPYGEITDITVDNFTKKASSRKHFSKRPCCPGVLYMADIWANVVYHRTFADIVQSEKFVSFTRLP